MKGSEEETDAPVDWAALGEFAWHALKWAVVANLVTSCAPAWWHLAVG